MKDAESYYALEPNCAIRRILPPFKPERLEIIRKGLSDAEAQFGADGPDAMLLEWGCGGLRIRQTISGRAYGSGLRLTDVADATLHTHWWDWDGDHKLMREYMPGDVVMRAGASDAEYFHGLEQLANELWPGENVRLTARGVRRLVTLLSGTWNFIPMDAYAELRGRIELVHHELDSDRQRHGERTGSLEDFAEALGRHAGDQVLIEAERAPQQVTWYENALPKPQKPPVRRIPYLVVHNVLGQCGLKMSTQIRSVGRIFIEAT